jgi:hypothetical protein
VGRAFDGLEILNLTTGASEAALPSSVTQARHVAISPDCSSIAVVSASVGGFGNRPTLTLYSRSGAVLDSYERSAGGTVDWFITDQEIIEFDATTGVVYDISADEVLFVLPEAFRPASLIDVSRDGSTFLVRASGGTYHAFDASGVDLGLVVPPEAIGFASPMLSPSGSYVAYATASQCSNPCAPNSSIPGTWLIATIDGVVVDRFPVSKDTPMLSRPTWVTDGLLALSRMQTYHPKNGTSVSNIEEVRWELFNPPTVVTSGIEFKLQYTRWAGR